MAVDVLTEIRIARPSSEVSAYACDPSTADGPFPMETTYTFEDANGATRMTLRNRGEPAGFAKVAAPVMARAMRRANNHDLERLRTILESGAR